MNSRKQLQRHFSVCIFFICVTVAVLCLCFSSIVRTGWARPGGQICPLLEPLYHTPVHRTEAIRLAQAALSTAPGVKEGIVTIDARNVLSADLFRGAMSSPVSGNVITHADKWNIGFPATLDLQKTTGWHLDPMTGIQYVEVNATTGRVERPTLQTGFASWVNSLLNHSLLEKIKQAHDRLSWQEDFA